MNRTVVVTVVVATAIITRCTHHQALAIAGQADTTTKMIIGIERRDIHIARTGVAVAHGAGLGAAVEIAIGKGEQVHRTGIGAVIARAIVIRRTHPQLGCRGIESHSAAKFIPPTQFQRTVLATGVAKTNRAFKRGASKIRVDE